MDRHEEAALVSKLVLMDERAWDFLCHTYASPLLRLIDAHFGCGRSTAEDIVQMAFLRCVRSIGTCDPARGRLYPWLKAVAVNEARSTLRHRNPDGLPLSQLPPETAAAVLDALDGAPLPEELLARADVRARVEETLLELNERFRMALDRKYLRGWKVAEIAAEAGITEKAAESLLTRARTAFRETFAAHAAHTEVRP